MPQGVSIHPMLPGQSSPLSEGVIPDQEALPIEQPLETPKGKTFRYHFFCPKCGFGVALQNKQTWAAVKAYHKKYSCGMIEAPDGKRTVLARPQLAAEAETGKALKEQAEEILAQARKKQVENFLGEDSGTKKNDSPDR